MKWRWCLLFLSLFGCAGSRLGSGQGRWHTLETRHFKLHTDLPQRAAEERALELENLLYALTSTAFEIKGEIPLKLNIVMFRSPQRFEDYVGRGVGGYVTPDVLFEPWMVLPATYGSDGTELLCHELAHHITFLAMQRQPTWYAEGVATYFESARFDFDGVRFQVGRVPMHYIDALREVYRLPPSQLIRENKFNQDLQYYASAWALAHYMMTERSDEFAEYQRWLAKGVGYDRAFALAFPGLTLEQLDEAVANYLYRGQFESISVPMEKLKQTEIKTRVLSQGEEYALDSILWSRCPHCSQRRKARSHESLQLALAADPKQLQAKSIQIPQLTDHAAALEEARTLADAHPDQPLAWLTLGFAANNVDPPTAQSSKLADQASERALALAPTQAYAWMLRAVRLATHGEREQALTAAARAQKLQRNSPNILTLHGLMLAQLSECTALRELVARMQEQPELAISASSRGKLEALAASCQPTAQP